MKKAITNYNRISLAVFVMLLLLVLIQVNWLRNVVMLQKQETHQKLQKLVPKIALEINSIDHQLFHSKASEVHQLSITEVENRIDSMLKINGLNNTTYFAVFQDTAQGVFLSNGKAFKNELLQSDIKSCLSCILSFSIVKDTAKLANESEDAYLKRIMEESEFQYYSPVEKLKKATAEIIWLSLYQPNEIPNAIKSLIWQFVISVLLLFTVVILVFHLIKSLLRHKRMGQVKDDFFNNMTHEFKTPLSSIRLASKVLRQSKDTSKNLTYHQLIENESSLLEAQIDKLLELSLFDSKELQLNMQKVDLHEIIQDVPKRLKILFDKKEADLQMDLQMDNPLINADYDHISNCLCNLVENSLKYSNKNVLINITTYQEENSKVVKITDNGPGIDSAYHDQVFNRFFRAKKDNQYIGKGFGIGLSYVKSIIESHGGSIMLNKNYVKGCEFIIKL